MAALEPPKRRRPVVAIIGANAGTELTDYLMPFGVLRRADVADVMAVSTTAGPVTLYPAALKVVPQATVSEFDTQYPEGADYLIVPAMSRDDDPAVLDFIKAQASRGAKIIGVCAGAKVVANAGLLDGKQATTHWYYLKTLRRKHPSIRYKPDRRIVADHGVVTTTGISASMPMSLMLIEAIAGRDKAEQVAGELGVMQWGARHRSDAFKFTRPFAVTALANRLAFWGHEQLGMEVRPGVDEVSLALVADAWSRTFRSRAVTFASAAGPWTTRGGIGIVPDQITTNWSAQQRLPALGDRPPAHALDHVLEEISARYGTSTGNLVAMQLEYPRVR
jgi:putative intracellular protease/amidase